MNVAGEASKGAFKVNSLGNLENADAGSGRLKWDAARSIWNMSFILGAAILGPMFFSWSGFLIFLGLSGSTLCVGHSVGFHRRLIHRSFDRPKWLERTMIYVGVLVGMGGPLWTVGLHDIRDWAQRQANCHWFLRHGKSVILDGFDYLNFRLLFDKPPQFDAGPGISDDPFLSIPPAHLDGTTDSCRDHPLLAWRLVVGRVGCGRPRRRLFHDALVYCPCRASPRAPDWFVEDAAVQGYNIAWLGNPDNGRKLALQSPRVSSLGPTRPLSRPSRSRLSIRAVFGVGRLGVGHSVARNLPPRSAITPLTKRALSIAAPGQEGCRGNSRGDKLSLGVERKILRSATQRAAPKRLLKMEA